MKKNTAHNLLEVKVLIEEAFQKGEEVRFNNTKWYKHDSEELICVSEIGLVGYTLNFKNYSTYKEL